VFRIEIDRKLCSGFGSCLDAAPGLIELGGDGIAVARVSERDTLATLASVFCCDDVLFLRHGASVQLWSKAYTAKR